MWDSDSEDDQQVREGRVKDLARRFDTIRSGTSGHVPASPLRRQKRIITKSSPPQIPPKNKLNCSSVTNSPPPPPPSSCPPCSSAPHPVKLNVGLLRKRPSAMVGGQHVRRRTRSAHDVSSTNGGGRSTHVRSVLMMRKSLSAHASIQQQHNHETARIEEEGMGQPISTATKRGSGVKPTPPAKPTRLQLKRPLGDGVVLPEADFINPLPSPASPDRYQLLITPSSSQEFSTIRTPSPLKSPRFERRRQFDSPPLPPAQPPPSPPKGIGTAALRSGSSGDIYEEIGITPVNFRKWTTMNCSNSSMPSITANTRAIKSYLQTDQVMSEETPERRSMFRSLYNGGQKNNTQKTKKPKRPKSSSIEFDRLLRFKSDIQLNITKKVGQIKLKVTSATAAAVATSDKSRREKATSMFYVDRVEIPSRGDPKNQDENNLEIRFPIDDRDACIYGDDWSSEEDWITDREEDSDTLVNKSAVGEGSMLSEIDAELARQEQRKLGQLPDLVPNIDAPSEQSTTPDDDDDDEQCSIITTLDLSQVKNETFTDAVCCHCGDEMSLCSSEYPNSSPEKLLQQPIYTSRLPDTQPLYQIYMLQHQQQQNNDIAALLATDDDVIKLHRHPSSSTSSEDSGRGADCSSTVTVSSSAITSSTSMRRERLVAASDFGSQRSLWCELPEVRSAGLLDRLDDETKKLQEAFFEVITSEASYLRSLNILITHFMAAPEMLGSKGTSSVITNVERKHLFSNIFAVRDCSERLLCDLETRLESNLLVDDVCDIMCEHLESNFEPYVKYCSNQVYQDRTLRKLKSECHPFMLAVQRLEQDRLCQGLDMRSFLMLPMQRVTRYPLLLIAILDRLSPTAAQRKTATRALHLANQAVSSCNEGARRMERTEQLLDVDRRLIYKSPDLKRIPLVSSGRYLVKKGCLTQLLERRTKTLLHNKQRTRALYLFLFNDILMITKKKLNGTFVCKDYAARRFVCVEPLELDQLIRQQQSSPVSLPHHQQRAYIFACTLTSNARGKLVEMILSADSESDRERWLSAIRPPTCSNPEEKVYADWDCPQAVVVHRYVSDQEDELQLEVGNLINILRKMPDGWFYGERVSDGVGGWFPSSYVTQVLNDHVRAKNYRDRWRVIQAAASIQNQQRRESVAASSNVSATIARRPQFISRLRRLSNPMAFFQQVN